MTNPNPDVTLLPPPWWEECQGRLEWELGCFQRHGIEPTIIEDPREGATRLVLEATSPLDEGPARVVVVYPDSYPHQQFHVYAPDLNLGRHQSPAGNLCLFPGDQWTNQCNAADAVVLDVPHLVRTTRTGGQQLSDAEIPQGEPISAYIGTAVQGAVLVNDPAVQLDLTDGATGDLVVGFRNGNHNWMLNPGADSGGGYLLSLRNERGIALLPDPTDNIARYFPTTIAGRWVYIDNLPASSDPTVLWKAAMDASPATGRWSNGYRKHEPIDILGIAYREEVQQNVYETSWMFLVRHRPDPMARVKATKSGRPGAQSTTSQTLGPNIVRGLRHTEPALQTRIPSLAPMRTKAVSLIGLGSIGAPIALELAKARIGHLTLLDTDVMDPGNLVRHPLGLLHAGTHKAMALGQAVLSHNFEVIVDAVDLRIGLGPIETPQVNARHLLANAVRGAHLAIGATAEHDVNAELDSVARSLSVPRLYLWSQSGYGGVVALLRQGETACFSCLLKFQSDMAKTGAPLVEVPDDTTLSVTVQAPGCSSLTFTATHPDLLPISIEATRMAFGFLCGPEDGYPPYDADVLAVQTRDITGAPIPPKWTAHKLPPTHGCSMCA